MSEQEILKKLGIQTGQEDMAQTPQLGMDFAANTMIAPFRSRFLYQVGTYEDWGDYVGETDDQGNEIDMAPFLAQEFNSGWKNLFYESYEQAKAVADVFDPNPTYEGREIENSPRQYWVLYGATRDALNVKDLDSFVEAVGSDLIYTVRVMTPRKASKKRATKERHEYIAIALPSAVAAVAKVFGYETPGFDLAQLTMAQDDDTFTDERFKLLAGDPEGAYDDCVLWNQREALWAALGEPDARKQAQIGALSVSGGPHNLATSSEKLSRCLTFLYGKWSTPIYLEVTNAKNPFPSAVSDSGRRYTIPCITKIFLSEDAARVDAARQLAEDGEIPDNEPAMPANPDWAGHRKEWVDFVKGTDAPTGPAPVKESWYREQAGCTEAEFAAWKTYLS